MTATSIQPTSPRVREITPVQADPIVVGVGGNDPTATLRAAQLLSASTNAEVFVVSALEPSAGFVAGAEFASVPAYVDSERRDAVRRAIVEDVDAVAGDEADWHVRVLPGSPARTLVEVAEREHASLIIMGIGRHLPIDRLFGAETTLRTIRRAGCPVLAVAPEFTALPRNVVVATDFSAASARAVEAALPLLDPVATLRFVHVWEPATHPENGAVETNRRYRDALPDRFTRFIHSIDIPSTMSVQKVAETGSAAERVIGVATAYEADLIVAGRHGLGMLERLMVGSVTSALLRRTSCSLFIAPAPSVIDADRFERLFSGTLECRTPREWITQLDAFSSRNAGRRTILEVDDVRIGAQSQERGYALLGTTYDRHDDRVEIMLGSVEGGTRHLTRGISDVESIAVMTDEDGVDVALRVAYRSGQSLLTFLPDTP